MVVVVDPPPDEDVEEGLMGFGGRGGLTGPGVGADRREQASTTAGPTDGPTNVAGSNVSVMKGVKRAERRSWKRETPRNNERIVGEVAFDVDERRAEYNMSSLGH